MRRLVALFVLALVGATIYGLSGQSSGLTVNHTSLSSRDFSSELNAIEHHETLLCYVYVLDPSTGYEKGAGGDSMKATGAATWANLRVEGFAIDRVRHLESESTTPTRPNSRRPRSPWRAR